MRESPQSRSSSHYHAKLNSMERTVNGIFWLVPQPHIMMSSGVKKARYVERSAEQAVVQMSARLVSLLRATYALLETGFVQEATILMRAINETAENILFLLSGLSDPEPMHEQFLHAFYAEADAEAAGNNEAAAGRSRSKPPERKKIRTQADRYVAEVAGVRALQGRLAPLLREAYDTQSGYVHGASRYIMNLYGGNTRPYRFYMRGMLGTPLIETGLKDFTLLVDFSKFVLDNAKSRLHSPQ